MSHGYPPPAPGERAIDDAPPPPDPQRCGAADTRRDPVRDPERHPGPALACPCDRACLEAEQVPACTRAHRHDCVSRRLGLWRGPRGLSAVRSALKLDRQAVRPLGRAGHCSCMRPCPNPTQTPSPATACVCPTVERDAAVSVAVTVIHRDLRLRWSILRTRPGGFGCRSAAGCSSIGAGPSVTHSSRATGP